MSAWLDVQLDPQSTASMEEDGRHLMLYLSDDAIDRLFFGLQDAMCGHCPNHSVRGNLRDDLPRVEVTCQE